MLCPGCNTEINEEANFCEKCGLNLKEINESLDGEKCVPPVEVTPEITVEIVEKEEVKKSCGMCETGKMERVSEEGSNPLFRCGSCGFYFGNFLKKGSTVYYDTTHLRIGQYIASQLVHGKFRVSVHRNQGDKGIEELADRIRNDIPLDRKKISDALSYLLNNNVLYTYYEPTPDGEFEWLGISFSDTVPRDSEITK
jgi:hypothetical protein